MQHLKKLGAGIALLSLGGCQSLAVMAIKSFDQKPYSLPVAAQALDVPTPEAQPAFAEAAPGNAFTASSAVTPPALAQNEPAPAPEPERTDIRGQGDGSMSVDRVVVTGGKEVPHRVPNYSREQVAAMVCAARNNERNTGRLKKARRAYDATVFAHDTRIAFEAGQRTSKEADTAERKRQDAVGDITGGMLFSLFGGRTKKEDLPKAEFEGLVLENVDLYTFNENGRPVMAVSGVVRNTTEERAQLPPLTLAAIDQWQFILAGQTSLLPAEALEPGESKSFELRFHNPPDTTAEVFVHFAPPFEYRMRRECDAADAALDTPSAAPRTAEQAAAIASSIHIASELNLLTRIYREEAQSTWNLRNCAKPKEEVSEQKKSDRGLKMGADGGGERRGFSISLGMDRFKADGLCTAWVRRLPWRESFALGEATDEAWGALLAAEEMKRQHAAGRAVQADVDAAEAASARAYANFRALGARTLARAGTSVPDIAVDITSSNFGYEQLSKIFDGADVSQVGFYVEVTGAVRNTASAPRNVGALMLALVDRLEQPLLTFRLDESMQLAAGETREFKHRVYLAEPIRMAESIRREEGTKPAWQLRIGAVAEAPPAPAS